MEFVVVFINFPLSFPYRNITSLSSDQKLTVLLGGLSQHVTVVDESRCCVDTHPYVQSLCPYCLCQLTALCTAVGAGQPL